jgi:hypothetical protein
VEGNPFAIKHKQKHYFVFGDGGPFCGGKSNFTAGIADYRPLQVSDEGIPEVRSSGIYTDGYNAHLFANIIMWAIKYR